MKMKRIKKIVVAICVLSLVFTTQTAYAASVEKCDRNVNDIYVAYDLNDCQKLGPGSGSMPLQAPYADGLLYNYKFHINESKNILVVLDWGTSQNVDCDITVTRFDMSGNYIGELYRVNSREHFSNTYFEYLPGGYYYIVGVHSNVEAGLWQYGMYLS